MRLTETTVGWFHTHLKNNIRYKIRLPQFDISTVSMRYLTLRIVK